MALEIGKSAISAAIEKALVGVILGSRIPLPGGGGGGVPVPGGGTGPVIVGGAGGKFGAVLAKVRVLGLVVSWATAPARCSAEPVARCSTRWALAKARETGGRIGAGVGAGAAFGPVGALVGLAGGMLYDSFDNLNDQLGEDGHWYNPADWFNVDERMNKRAREDAAKRLAATPPPQDFISEFYGSDGYGGQGPQGAPGQPLTTGSKQAAESMATLATTIDDLTRRLASANAELAKVKAPAVMNGGT